MACCRQWWHPNMVNCCGYRISDMQAGQQRGRGGGQEELAGTLWGRGAAQSVGQTEACSVLACYRWCHPTPCTAMTTAVAINVTWGKGGNSLKLGVGASCSCCWWCGVLL